MSSKLNHSQKFVMGLTCEQFKKSVDAKFRRFADNLRASQGYHNEGIRLCEKVRKLLEQAVRTESFSIAATHPGGSMAKGTDLENSDFDIVMKINNRSPFQFYGVLQFFKCTLANYSDDLGIVPNTIRTTHYSVQFTFANGMKVDLLPASAQLTFEEIIEKMKLDPRNKRYYSSGLVEKQVGFMKKQSSFCKALARLAKHWYKSMDCTFYVSGGSMIFELLAAAAAFEQKGSGRESMSAGFVRIVEMVENFDGIGIKFKRARGSYGPWRLKGKIRLDLEESFILEPTNPSNDLLDGLDWDELKIFIRNGEEMSGRLWNLMEKRQYCRKGGQSGEMEINFEKLFKTFDYDGRETSSESEEEDNYCENKTRFYDYSYEDEYD